MLVTFLTALSLFFTPPNALRTEPDVVGRWVASGVKGRVTTYVRALPVDLEGAWIGFDEAGGVSVRQNSGWCGTPPVQLRTYEGSYTLHGDTLTMQHDFWGGTTVKRFVVQPGSRGELRLQFIDRVGD